MRIAYFDTFSGVSGDMTIGAFIALGLPLAAVRDAVDALDLTGVRVEAEPTQRMGIAATKFHVRVHGLCPDRPETRAAHPGHRAYRDIRRLLEQSRLAPVVRERSLAVFGRLAAAEAEAHGVEPDAVTFHEVGAVDAIVDVVGAALGITELGVDVAYVGPLPLGTGRAQSAHGALPVPGPAVTALLTGRAVRFEDGAGELVTPTGAAIVAALTDPGQVPPLRVERVGYGAGDRHLDDRPNLLRVVLGEPIVPAARDAVVVLEASVDDMNPELWEHVVERLLAAGARDAWLVPAIMKRGRPGAVLRVLLDPGDRERLAAIVFAETSTIGLRWTTWERLVLPREVRTVATAYGPVSVKIAQAPDGTLNVAPEMRDCRRVARERGVPLKLVYQAAVAAARPR